MKILTILMIYFGFFLPLYGCSLCKTMTPMVHVDIKIQNINNQISLDIKWEMPKDFSKYIFVAYDSNKNNIIEKSELIKDQKTLEEYLQSNNYATFLQTHNISSIEYKIDDRTLTYDTSKKQFIYRYNISFDAAILEEFLSIELFDKNNYFDFALIELDRGDIKVKSIDKTKNTIALYFENGKNKISTPSSQQQTKITNSLGEIFAAINSKIRTNMQSIKDENNLESYIWLFCFAFFYGIVHAIGPGHGKSLVGAYFLTQQQSYKKALGISLSIGIVHTFSAFLLTFIIYFLLENLLFTNYADVEFYAQKVSAFIIIIIGIVLLRKKLMTIKKPNKVRFSLTPIKSQYTGICGCESCHTKSNDFGVVLAAAIVPCPTTVTIFIFTMSLGIYFAGFVAALVMSLGMSLIIFASAFVSIKLKKQIVEPKWAQILEYSSLIFIITLGGILLVI